MTDSIEDRSDDEDDAERGRFDTAIDAVLELLDLF